MRLLITTQAVDQDDPVLGFFHGWVTEFAKHFDEIYVICLREGKHSLPPNVHVNSLGKERRESRVGYVIRFYKHLFHIRGTYGRVFVHMNPHYVILGGVLWKFFGIPIFFWRNHARMNMMTEIAARFAQKVFYTSPYACTSRYSHAVQMPVGIDTLRFTPTARMETSARKILFLGRMSPVKRVAEFVRAVALLPEGYEAHLYGDAPRQDQAYFESVKREAGINTFFHPAVTNRETPALYRAHALYVNLTPDGSMDKTVLEALACGTPALVANQSFSDVLPHEALVTDVTPHALADTIVAITTMDPDARQERFGDLHAKVESTHSLKKLAETLHRYITNDSFHWTYK